MKNLDKIQNYGYGVKWNTLLLTVVLFIISFTILNAQENCEPSFFDSGCSGSDANGVSSVYIQGEGDEIADPLVECSDISIHDKTDEFSVTLSPEETYEIAVSVQYFSGYWAGVFIYANGNWQKVGSSDETSEFSTGDIPPFPINIPAGVTGEGVLRIIAASPEGFEDTEPEWLACGVYSAGSGVDYTVNFTDDSEPAPTNDTCTDAIPISIGGNGIIGDNTGATYNGPDVTCGDDTDAIQNDIWFSFVAPQNGNLTIETSAVTGSAFTDTKMQIFDSCDGSVMECNDSDGDGEFSLINMPCDAYTPGQTYYVQISGNGESTGEFNLKVTSDGVTECIPCLQDSLSFADVVIEYVQNCPNNQNTDAQNALGMPDGPSVSLGRGHIILGFTDNTLSNSGDSSPDLYIFEVGPLVEPSFIELRPSNQATIDIIVAAGILDSDGDGFYEFGGVGGSTADIDIDSFFDDLPANSIVFDAIKIIDAPGNCATTSPGADIAGVCALSSIGCVVGEPCDDGDPLTENDMLNEDCECEGTPIEITECEDPYNEDAASSDIYISNIQMAGIGIDQGNTDYDLNYTSNSMSVDGYEVNTNPTVTIYPGLESSYTVSSGPDGNNNQYYYSVWIDFNQDGCFDPEEQIIWSNDIIWGGGIPNGAVGVVDVPYTFAELAPGTYQGRIRNSMINHPMAGGNGDGEALDFTINVITQEEAEMMLGKEGHIFENFTFYPNPVNDQLTLKAGSQIESVIVYNLLGQELISAQPNSLEAQINTETLQSGVYLMEVSINGSQKSFRVVKR